MKINPLFAFVTGALLLAGCDDMPDTVREGLGGDVPPHVRVFTADQKATYAAARAALTQMGYRFEHGGAAQGRIEAISGISNEDSMSTAQQFSLKATLSPATEGGTEVSVKMTEIIEENSEHLGRATETPLTDTPLYEVFFRGIQQALAEPPK